MTEAQRHCEQLVRQHAWDHYIASLFMPEAKRPHALALYAFDAEIARIRRSVSEPHLGLVRQQWWLDTIDGIFAGAVPAHPVAEALAAAVALGNLPRHGLRAMVLAREFDLYGDAMPDLKALETYLGETSSILIHLAALMLAGANAGKSAGAAGLAGVAIGLARALHERPLRHLPEGMDAAAAETHARRRLEEARKIRSTIAEAARPAFLPAALTELYLRGAASARTPSPLRRQLTMWWRARANRF